MFVRCLNQLKPNHESQTNLCCSHAPRKNKKSKNISQTRKKSRGRREKSARKTPAQPPPPRSASCAEEARCASAAQVSRASRCAASRSNAQSRSCSARPASRLSSVVGYGRRTHPEMIWLKMTFGRREWILQGICGPPSRMHTVIEPGCPRCTSCRGSG